MSVEIKRNIPPVPVIIVIMLMGLLIGTSLSANAGGSSLQIESGTIVCVIPTSTQDGTCNYNYPQAFTHTPAFFILDSHPPVGNRTDPILFPNIKGTFLATN